MSTVELLSVLSLALRCRRFIEPVVNLLKSKLPLQLFRQSVFNRHPALAAGNSSAVFLRDALQGNSLDNGKALAINLFPR